MSGFPTLTLEMRNNCERTSLSKVKKRFDSIKVSATLVDTFQNLPSEIDPRRWKIGLNTKPIKGKLMQPG